MTKESDILAAFNSLDPDQLSAVVQVEKILTISSFLFELLLEKGVDREHAQNLISYLVNNANLNILKEASVVKSEEDYLEVLTKIKALMDLPREEQLAQAH